MKRPLYFLVAVVVASLPIAVDAQGHGKGQGKGKGMSGGKGRGGMPEEMRETIHGLFDGHDKIQREVKITETGYRSTTTSKNPAVANFLQTHVKQMEKRLDSGMMVRRWDPAYEEFVKHYDDIKIEFTSVEGGIAVVATGLNEDARKVARNHAGIISKFVEHGWSEHDKIHPAVLSGKNVAQPVTAAKLGETKNVHQIGELFIAAQPSPDDLNLAREEGIKTVLSIRHTDELDFDEKKEVEKLGMNFVQIPWNGEDELTDEIFDKIRVSLQTAESPILLHCGTSNRAAGAWLPWRVLDQGIELEKAVQEAKMTGLRSEVYEAKARAYIKKRKAIPAFSDAQRMKCLELGEKASSALMKNLGTQLKAALSAGDPMAAVAVCKTNAQPITAATNGEFAGTSTSRTSLKTRNTESNSPDATDRQLLTQWAHMADHSHELKPTLVPIHENAVRYYRPIFIQEACLKCHGPAESIDRKLRDFLSDAYPNDRALGYNPGDLRGVFRVEIDLEKAFHVPE